MVLLSFSSTTTTTTTTTTTNTTTLDYSSGRIRACDVMVRCLDNQWILIKTVVEGIGYGDGGGHYNARYDDHHHAETGCPVSLLSCCLSWSLS